MPSTRLIAFLITLCVVTSLDASSQSPTSPSHTGERIRVQRFDSRHARTGTLISHTDDSLTVEWLSGARESMPNFEVQRLDVSNGQRHYVKRGMMYGFLMGAGVGLIINKLAANDSSKWGSKDLRPKTGLIGVAAGGGVAFGALAGAMGTEDWRAMAVRPAGSRTGLIAPSSPTRLAVALRAKF